jgi:hypothetical protein
MAGEACRQSSRCSLEALRRLHLAPGAPARRLRRRWPEADKRPSAAADAVVDDEAGRSGGALVDGEDHGTPRSADEALHQDEIDAVDELVGTGEALVGQGASRHPDRKPTLCATMPPLALSFALAAAFLHAFWNLLIARSRDPESATLVALIAAVVAFALVTVATWRLTAACGLFIAVTSVL